MKMRYYPDTDTLYIELNEAHGMGTRECAEDMTVDIDANGKPIGIEIEHASEKTDLSRLKTKGLASMRLVHDPLIYTSDPPHGEPRRFGEAAGTVFVVDVGGNGDTGRVVSDLLGRQTEGRVQELLR